MPRPLAAFCLAGAVLLGAEAMAQTPRNPPQAVRVEPVASQPVGAPAAEGDVPAGLLDKIRADLASAQGLAPGDVKVVGTRAVDWPNGALGCPKPGVMYTQAIVPGYRVELEAGGKRFTYNASARGGFKRCDTRFTVPSGSTPRMPGAAK
jgi:hypothetical protein